MQKDDIIYAIKLLIYVQAHARKTDESNKPIGENRVLIYLRCLRKKSNQSLILNEYMYPGVL